MPAKKYFNADDINKMFHERNINIVCKYYADRRGDLKCGVCGYEWSANLPNILNRGCPMCNNHANIDTLERANYFLKRNNISGIICIDYCGKKAKEKSTFKCKKCGFIFKKELFYYNNKTGDNLCPCCGKSARIGLSKEEINYILKYKNINATCIGVKHKNDAQRNALILKCNVCGDEFESPITSLNNKKFVCFKCANVVKFRDVDIINDEFKENGIKLECIEYSGNTESKSNFKCMKCGKTFKNTFDKIKYRGQRCPFCNGSSGEKMIMEFLESRNIRYEFQKTFDGCENINKLRFDFYIPSINICIEYQGKQHECPITRFGGKEGFDLQKFRDNIKKEYCRTHNIKLLEIWYYDDISEVLTKELNLR